MTERLRKGIRIVSVAAALAGGKLSYDSSTAASNASEINRTLSDADFYLRNQVEVHGVGTLPKIREPERALYELESVRDQERKQGMSTDAVEKVIVQLSAAKTEDDFTMAQQALDSIPSVESPKPWRNKKVIAGSFVTGLGTATFLETRKRKQLPIQS